MVTREPCPTCGQSEATPRRTVPSSAGYRCPDCKRFKIREYDPWDWTASLGPENSSEVGTGAKDATGGRKSNCEDCFVCLDKPELGIMNPTLMQMIVCHDCGGKRCPRARDHDNDCTGHIPIPEYPTHRMVRAEALEAAVRAERKRIAAELDHHLELMRIAPFSSAGEAYQLKALVHRIRAGKL